MMIFDSLLGLMTSTDIGFPGTTTPDMNSFLQNVPFNGKPPLRELLVAALMVEALL